MGRIEYQTTRCLAFSCVNSQVLILEQENTLQKNSSLLSKSKTLMPLKLLIRGNKKTHFFDQFQWLIKVIIG